MTSSHRTLHVQLWYYWESFGTSTIRLSTILSAATIVIQAAFTIVATNIVIQAAATTATVILADAITTAIFI